MCACLSVSVTLLCLRSVPPVCVCVSVCVRAGTCTMMCIQRLEYNSVVLLFSSHLSMGFGDQTQIGRLPVATHCHSVISLVSSGSFLDTFYLESSLTKSPRLALNLPSSFLSLPSSWYHRPKPSCLAIIQLRSRKL